MGGEDRAGSSLAKSDEHQALLLRRLVTPAFTRGKKGCTDSTTVRDNVGE